MDDNNKPLDESARMARNKKAAIITAAAVATAAAVGGGAWLLMRNATEPVPVYAAPYDIEDPEPYCEYGGPYEPGVIDDPYLIDTPDPYIVDDPMVD